MIQRRSTKLRPAVPPLTPDPKTVEPLTYAELQNQNNYLRFIMAGERRRHGVVERNFVHTLDELQNQIDDLRLLYVEGISQNMKIESKQ